MWVYSKDRVLVEVAVGCVVLLLGAFFSAQPHILYKWNRRKLVLTWNFEQSAAESAASNERLVEVSNKRITSFVGFQRISGYLRAHSAAPYEPRPFTDGGGRGLAVDPPWSVHQGSWHFHRPRKTNLSLILMENFILTFQRGANQDDCRLSFCNHLSRSGFLNRGTSVDPSNLSELNEIHHRSG